MFPLSTEKSKSAAVNLVVREAALDMAEGLYRIDVREHIPGVTNLWPDALSRVGQPNMDAHAFELLEPLGSRKRRAPGCGMRWFGSIGCLRWRNFLR